MLAVLAETMTKHNNNVCDDVRQEFIDCVLKNSDCVRQEGTTFKDCITPALLPEKCKPLRLKLFECRKSMVRKFGKLNIKITIK